MNKILFWSSKLKRTNMCSRHPKTKTNVNNFDFGDDWQHCGSKKQKQQLSSSCPGLKTGQPWGKYKL